MNIWIRLILVSMFVLAVGGLGLSHSAPNKWIGEEVQANISYLSAEQLKQKYMKELVILRRLQAADERLSRMQIRFAIAEDGPPNAWAQDHGSNGGVITITTSMIRLMNRDEDLVASILAHELSHIKNGDVYDWTVRGEFCNRQTRVCETQADLSGKDIMAKAGYNECMMSHAFKIMLAMDGDPEDPDHPPLKARIKYTQCERGAL